MKTSVIVKGNHTRKTAAFVRVSDAAYIMLVLLPWLQACAAYCFITIPSLTNILDRLNLYLLSGRVAIANGALTQGVVMVTEIILSLCVVMVPGDAFFKAAISSIKDVPEIIGLYKVVY